MLKIAMVPISTLILSTFCVSALAVQTELKTLNFAAPLVKDVNNLPGDVPFGTIVYDSVTGQFSGYSPNENGKWLAFNLPVVRSVVTAGPASGYGSTGTKIRTWSNASVIGSDISYTPSSSNGNNGDMFTVTTDGVYAITYCDQGNAVGNYAITKNEISTFTTNAYSLSRALLLMLNNTPGTNFGTCLSVTVPLEAGDKIRAHSDGTPSGTNSNIESFYMTKVNS